MKRILEGRIAVVTGANRGLGLEIARKYVVEGASVVLCARNGTLLNAAASELRGAVSGNQQVLAIPTDVANPGDTNRLVDAAMDQFGRIDVLVNNAGVYGPMGAIEDIDWQEWMRAIEINLCGSILMCRAVLPVFKKQHHGKIVQLSGGGATNPLPRLSAYAVSKAAIVRFVETLALEVREFNIDVNAIAPGALNTGMLDEVLAAGPDRVGLAFYERAEQQKAAGGTALDQGAALAAFLASVASDGITGKLISAVWDPWRELPEHLVDLADTDIYTLRRIVPQDRGMSWGRK